MGRSKETNSGEQTRSRYWTVPKVPVGLKMDKNLIDRAKAAAKARKIPFTTLVAMGIERELAASKHT